MAFPKHTKWAPPRPIVSNRASIMYAVTKELANIIYTLVGLFPPHLKSTQHSLHHNQKVELEPGEFIMSFDVKAPFTSVPVDPSISIVKQKLNQDPTLPQKTNMSMQEIVTLLEFCLKITYFLFQSKYYKQVHGTAMGSPISPLIVNLFIEELKIKALSSATQPPTNG